ncbi:MAG: hypothetical protein NXI10_02195 [bacterium]|nr:hypothetical protein [bacterium]
MRIQPKYILLASDAIIPLLGLFIWNWSLYFILLFYLLDLAAREVLTHFKTREIYRIQGLRNTQKWQRKGLLSGGLFIVVVVAIHAAVWWMQPDINFLKELVAFWQYEELGIQQGYILLPLIVYAAYAQYRMSFLMPGKARTVLMDSLWKQHIIALLLILAGAILAAAIGSFVNIPEAVTVCSIVLFAGAYTLTLEKI